MAVKTWWYAKVFRFTSPLWVESTGDPSQRPETWSFDVFVDLCLNKRLSKQSRRRWFETKSLSLCRHCNEDLLWLAIIWMVNSYCVKLIFRKYKHIFAFSINSQHWDAASHWNHSSLKTGLGIMIVNGLPMQEPGPRLNIKTVLSTYGDFHVKDKTAVRTSYL